MKAIVLILIVGLIALAAIFPVSAAGGNCNGKMMQNGSCSSGTQVCQNPDCPRGDCMYNQTPPRDGTGMQYGRGQNS